MTYRNKKGATRLIVSAATKVQNNMVWIRIVLTNGFCVYSNPKTPHHSLFLNIYNSIKDRDMDVCFGRLSFSYKDVKKHPVFGKIYDMYTGVDSFVWKCDVGSRFITSYLEKVRQLDMERDAEIAELLRKADEVAFKKERKDCFVEIYSTIDCLSRFKDEDLKQSILEVVREVCTPREACAIELFIWGAEATFVTVGNEFRVSRERARQIVYKGERKLRFSSNARRLREAVETVITMPESVYDGGLTEYAEFPYRKKKWKEDYDSNSNFKLEVGEGGD